MTRSSRRDFLRKAAGAVPGAAVAGSLGACAPDASGGAGTSGEGDAGGALPARPLAALAEVTLPVGALGVEGTRAAVRDFAAWVQGFEPAAELDHPYLTGALRYAPPHPGPRWASQLEAMEIEAERRTGTPFSRLPAEERRSLVSDVLREGGATGLPGSPAVAAHVAVGLLAWFYGTSLANDLCYGAEIGRHICRGTATLPEQPRLLGGA